MTLEQVSYVADIVGVVAIVASLIYLAGQLRQNTKSVRLSTVHNISSLYASVMLSTGGDKENCDIWLRGLQEYGELNGTEKARFLVLIGVSVRALSEQFYQWKEGALDDELWAGMKYVIDDFTQYQGFRAYWKLRSHQFAASFRAYVDEVLQRPTSTARPLYDAT